MTKLLKQILMLTALLAAACAVIAVTTRGQFELYIPGEGGPGDPGEIRIETEGDGRAAFGEPSREGGKLRFAVRAEQPGTLAVEMQNQKGEPFHFEVLEVMPTGQILNRGNGNFSGDAALLTAFAVYASALCLLLAAWFLRASGPDIYSYQTIYTGGFSVFTLLTAALLIYASVSRLKDPGNYSMMNVYGMISGAPLNFLMVTAPLIIVFSGAMIISNAALLRHERKRLANVLGILISVLMLAGGAVLLGVWAQYFSGSELEFRIRNTVLNVLGTVYVYFECMLLGSVICGIRAVRHKVAPDRDYIIILGCRFRKDGTLTPLLKGRVDRAVSFWKEQKEKTGKTAVLIPSGGQGADESMPEAEAMRRYLLTQGIPDDLILPEDQSKNTYQNMEYSKKLIESEKKDARVAYATTNYHVFRGGVWANLAGLRAEGLGSPTKWWFWPNAFMRECIGLLRNRLREELLLLAVLSGLFGFMSMFLY